MSKRHRLQANGFAWRFTVDQICGGENPTMSRSEFDKMKDGDCVIYGAVARCFGDGSCQDCTARFTKKDCLCYTRWMAKKDKEGK